MYDMMLRNLASFFVDASRIKISGTLLAKLLLALDNDDLVPDTIQDVSPTGSVPRPMLRNQKDGSLIVLGSQRFDYMYLSPEPTTDAFRLFANQAGTLLAALADFFSLEGHRLALVREGFLHEMPESDMTELASQLLQQPDEMSKFSPFEWDWRNAWRVGRAFGGLEEETNTIITIKRCSGTIKKTKLLNAGEVPFDRIRVDFDVNTSPSKDEARFGAEQVVSFYRSAPSWYDELEQMVLGMLADGE